MTTRPTKCPQCGEAVIQLRDGTNYCEECGWPEENRKPLLPDGVAKSWFHVHCGGEIWFSRVCRGSELLKVLEEAMGDAEDYCAERLADADNWYVNEGVCRSISLACGEDPDIEIDHIEDPAFAKIMAAHIANVEP